MSVNYANQWPFMQMWEEKRFCTRKDLKNFPLSVYSIDEPVSKKEHYPLED